MFGEQDQPVAREKIGAEWLADLYATQLSKVFPNVSKPVIMNNSKNSPLYALFVASHKDNAIKIMNEIALKYQLQKLSR